MIAPDELPEWLAYANELQTYGDLLDQMAKVQNEPNGEYNRLLATLKEQVKTNSDNDAH